VISTRQRDRGTGRGAVRTAAWVSKERPPESAMSASGGRLARRLRGRGRRGETLAVLRAVELPVCGVALLDGAPPLLVVSIPPDRLGQPLLEGRRRLEAEPGELRRVERVAAIVPRPVVHETQQGLRLAELREDAPRDRDVLALVAAR